MTTLHCAVKPAIPTRKIIVSVNGAVVPREAIAREIQHYPAATAAEAWKEAAKALVVRELLLQEARRLGVAALPDQDAQGRRETEEEALIRALVDQEVETPKADTAACRRYYEQNLRRFRSSDLYETRHILFPATADDAAARKTAWESAVAAIEQLGRDASAFGVLAAAMSACPSGKTGGNLGQIGPGQTVHEFEQALATLTVGSVHSEPVETRYGFHVVAVDRRIEGRQLTFDIVQQRIAGWLNEKVRRLAIQQYVTILAGRADITGVEIAATRSPLVQ